jgi:hypothetical protein
MGFSDFNVLPRRVLGSRVVTLTVEKRTFSIPIRWEWVFMLTIIGQLARLFKKDIRPFANYEKSHIHFFWYLGVDALISVVIVFGGYSLYVNMTSDTHVLAHVGARVVTSQELVEHVNGNNVLAYWLGSSPGYEYTINHANPDVADIFYWRKGEHNVGNKEFLYEIKTYEDRKAWDSRTHTIMANTNIETVVVNPEIAIRINPTSMKGVIVTFAGYPEIVGIAYPAPQTLENMIKNVESLERIQ